MPLSFKDVAEILKIVDASDCEEVILEIEGTRLVVRTGQNVGLGGGAASTSSVGASTTAAPASAEQPAPSPRGEGTGGAATEKIDQGLVAVRYPIVGPAYRRRRAAGGALAQEVRPAAGRPRTADRRRAGRGLGLLRHRGLPHRHPCVPGQDPAPVRGTLKAMA